MDLIDRFFSGITPEQVGGVLAFVVAAVIVWKIWTALPKWLLVVIIIVVLLSTGALVLSP